MSYLHLASTANPSSSSTSATPSSYLHVNSNGGVSTVSSNSSSLLGSIGGGKQWTTIGQPTSTSLAQQLLMKQPNLLNVQQSPSSSHFDALLGSSSQTSMEKKVEKKNTLHLSEKTISNVLLV